MEKRNNILLNLDWIIIIVYVTLLIIGCLNIFSVTRSETVIDFWDTANRHVKQLIWIAVSVVVILVILLVQSKIIQWLSYPLYILSIILLLSVLFFGTEINSSKSWFEIGSIRIQPVEFSKIAICLAVANFISYRSFSFHKIKDVLILMGIIFLPIACIILQNDTGSALVIFSLIFVFYREGLNKYLFYIVLSFAVLFMLAILVNILYLIAAIFYILILWYIFTNWKSVHEKIISVILLFFTSLALIIYFKLGLDESYLLYLLLGIVAIVILSLLILFFVRKYRKNIYFATLIFAGIVYILSIQFVFNNVLQDHQRNRINELLGKTEDVYGKGYHVRQSIIAIGSGETFGKGFLHGTQTRYRFVPEQSTDFIFCTIGEEWGFAGTSFVLLLFAVLIIRIIVAAEKQRSAFTRVYGYCIASILFFHIIVNIGMTVGLMPIIGIPLPFLSYGGSSILAFSILLFIFVKLDSDRIQIL